MYKYCCVVCETQAQGRVKRKYLTEAALHEAVYTAIMAQIKTCADTRRNAERAFSAGPAATERTRVEAEIRRLRADIARYDAKTMRAYDDFCEGVLSEGDYRMITGRYEAEHTANLSRVDELETALSKLRLEYVSENPSITEFERFSGIKELSREMLTAMIKRINVTGELKLEIQYTFADEYAALLELLGDMGGADNE